MLQTLHPDFDSAKRYVTESTLWFWLSQTVCYRLHSDFDSAKQCVTDSTLWFWLCQTVCYRLYTMTLTLPNSMLQTLHSEFDSAKQHATDSKLWFLFCCRRNPGGNGGWYRGTRQQCQTSRTYNHSRDLDWNRKNTNPGLYWELYACQSLILTAEP